MSNKRKKYSADFKAKKQGDAQVDELHRQIGKLKVENDFLSRRLGF